MKTQQHKPFSLFRWILDSFWGWLLGIILILVLSSLLDSIGIENVQFYVGMGVITGISLAQYRHIRNYFHQNISWIVWSIFSFSIPFILLDGIKYYGLYSFSQNSLVFCVCMGTLMLSINQYFLLRKTISHPLSWLVFSIVGWSFAGLATFALEYIPLLIKNNWIVFSINLALILSGGILIGISTGMAVQKILKETDTSAHH
ncbi:MAG TPA: hypothetical protein PLI74_03800 [Candidatus Kapabacteria bacterium]|nr:hypothetical protein [Candidatus Kapabacteria bacterium]HRK58742.1 hypothetical protein [Candidatus Kapabacteria bacterium]